MRVAIGLRQLVALIVPTMVLLVLGTISAYELLQRLLLLSAAAVLV